MFRESQSSSEEWSQSASRSSPRSPRQGSPERASGRPPTVTAIGDSPQGELTSTNDRDDEGPGVFGCLALLIFEEGRNVMLQPQHQQHVVFDRRETIGIGPVRIPISPRSGLHPPLGWNLLPAGRVEQSTSSIHRSASKAGIGGSPSTSRRCPRTISEGRSPSSSGSRGSRTCSGS